MVVAAAGLASVVAGAVVVGLGTLRPRYASPSELVGGLLVVAGLILIGSRLAVFRF